MGSKYPLLRSREVVAALSQKGFWLKSILIQADIELDEFLKLL